MQRKPSMERLTEQKKVYLKRNGHGNKFNGEVFDRIIHFPRPHNIRCAKVGSKLDGLLKILEKGCTVDEIMTYLNIKGKPVSERQARNWLNWPVNHSHGYGIGMKNGQYVLIYPEGIKELMPNQLNPKALAMLAEIKKLNPVSKK